MPHMHQAENMTACFHCLPEHRAVTGTGLHSTPEVAQSVSAIVKTAGCSLSLTHMGKPHYIILLCTGQKILWIFR